MGRFKGETGERNVMFAIANVSQSGFGFREAIEKVVDVLKKEGHHHSVGPAFCDARGKVMVARQTHKSATYQRQPNTHMSEQPNAKTK